MHSWNDKYVQLICLSSVLLLLKVNLESRLAGAIPGNLIWNKCWCCQKIPWQPDKSLALDGNHSCRLDGHREDLPTLLGRHTPQAKGMFNVMCGKTVNLTTILRTKLKISFHTIDFISAASYNFSSAPVSRYRACIPALVYTACISAQTIHSCQLVLQIFYKQSSILLKSISI